MKQAEGSIHELTASIASSAASTALPQQAPLGRDASHFDADGRGAALFSAIPA
jgi:hypothetical protein